MTKRKTIPTPNLQEIEADYLTITPDDDDMMVRLKERVKSLDRIDKTFMLLYIEHASLRKVATELDISLTTACKRIAEIKKKLTNPPCSRAQ